VYTPEAEERIPNEWTLQYYFDYLGYEVTYRLAVSQRMSSNKVRTKWFAATGPVVVRPLVGTVLFSIPGSRSARASPLAQRSQPDRDGEAANAPESSSQIKVSPDTNAEFFLSRTSQPSQERCQRRR
jgi:hypothetical protein